MVLMPLTAVQSWVTLGMVFALVVLLLWVSHERLTRGNGQHRIDAAEDWDLIHHDGDDWVWP